MPKRTNRPGMSTTNRPPRGRGAFRGARGVGRGYYGGFRPMRRPRFVALSSVKHAHPQKKWRTQKLTKVYIPRF